MGTQVLKKLVVQHFKNLTLGEGLDFNNLNIFIGPNGSGKSNFLATLNFLRNALTASFVEDILVLI